MLDFICNLIFENWDFQGNKKGLMRRPKNSGGPALPDSANLDSINKNLDLCLILNAIDMICYYFFEFESLPPGGDSDLSG